MRYTWIGGAAGLALLIAATPGLAQAQDRDRGRGGAEAPGAAPERPPSVERSRSPQRIERAPQGQSVERPQRERVQRAEPRQSKGPARVERQTEPKRVTKEAMPKSVQPERAAREKNAPNRNEARSSSGRQLVNRAQITNEQRAHVHQTIFGESGLAHISRKDFGRPITVGSRVNRRHHLRHLTPAILVFAPFYSGYDYIVVEDTICIVDPDSYLIVDLIPASVEYAEGSHRPQLALSAGDMHFIYASVPRDRTADVRVRLALGAEVPGRVDLESFPDGVVDRVPQIANYRYIVAEGDVVIVDPNDRSVALVITE
jgi:Protein of unknown function (DUF1236)